MSRIAILILLIYFSSQNTSSTKGTKNDANSAGFSQKKLEKTFEKYKGSHQKKKKNNISL